MDNAHILLILGIPFLLGLAVEDPENWEMIRQALRRMNRADLIGDGPRHLVPAHQPGRNDGYKAFRRKITRQAHQRTTGKLYTQHTGLPPCETGDNQQDRFSRRQRARAGKRR